MHRPRQLIDTLESRRLLATVTVTGTGNADTILVSQAATNLVVTVNGNQSNYPLATTDDLVINAGAGADTVTIDLAPVSVQVNGETGNDAVICTPTAKTLDVLVGSITFNGGADTDTFTLRDDNAGPTGRTYLFGAIDPNVMFRIGSPFCSWSNVESLDLRAGSGDDRFDFSNTFPGTTYNLFGNAGVDTYDIFTTPGSSKVVATGGPGDDIIRARSGATQIAVVEIPADDQIGILSATATGTIRLTDRATVRLTNTWTNAGTFDIGSGALITVDGATNFDELSFQEQLYQGTLGNSPRVISSVANSSAIPDQVGLGAGSNIAISTLGGFAIAPNDMVLRYTMLGDFNLSGTTNFDDLLRLAANYNTLVDKVFTQGDANYDGGVDFDDLLKLASAYNQSVPVAAPLALPDEDAPDDAGNDVLQ
jgi:hypothetical protein